MLNGYSVNLKAINILYISGREERIKVSPKHAVNGNPTVPPFPDEMEMAMFGNYIIHFE